MDPAASALKIKLELAPEELGRLKEHISGKSGPKELGLNERINSTYYDTEDFALRDAGAVLRLRADGAKVMQLLKTNGAAYRFFDDISWEQPTDHEPDFKFIHAGALPPLLTEKICPRLKPAFKVNLNRTMYLLHEGESEIRAAACGGKIDLGERSAGFAWIEFHLLDGKAADLFSLMWAIDEVVPLRLATESEDSLGYRLLKNQSKKAEKPVDITLAPGLTSAEAFRVIAHSCVQQIAANEKVISPANAECLHQMRVGLRRLRSALSLFGWVVNDTQVDTIKSELRWITEILGRARDIDVFLSEVMLPLRKQYREEPGLLSLHRTYASQRTKAYERVTQATGSVRYRSLLLELMAWIEDGPWANNNSAEGRVKRAEPVAYFAVNELSRRRRKVKKRGALMKKLDPDERHALRLQVKKLRYAAEFFVSLFPGKKRKKREFFTTLKDLQTALGEVNDIAVRTGLKAEIIGSKPKRANGPREQHRAFAAGLIIGHQKARYETLLKMAERAYGDFLDAKPIWKSIEIEGRPNTGNPAEDRTGASHLSVITGGAA
jgi:inorganic triphosphatase YgiF